MAEGRARRLAGGDVVVVEVRDSWSRRQEDEGSVDGEERREYDCSLSRVYGGNGVSVRRREKRKEWGTDTIKCWKENYSQPYVNNSQPSPVPAHVP
jgi:hypothetical protein